MTDPVIKILLFCVCAVLSAFCGTNGEYFRAEFPFRDHTLPVDQRVDDLLSRLTIGEVINQTVCYMVEATPGIPRLGISPYVWDTECMRGQMMSNGTSFPQNLGLAATFSVALLREIAAAISSEVRAHWNANRRQSKYLPFFGLSCFSPEMNIMRHPLWGRNQETYGEDPYLSGQLASAFVQGLRGDDATYTKVSAGCKSFDAYSGPDGDNVRFSFNAKISERDLRMTYMPAYKACVEAGVSSVMCSYNSINGIPSCANQWLLGNVLRDEWGFQGYVVSDNLALHMLMSQHHYVATVEDAAAVSMRAGVNLELTDNQLPGVHWHLPQALAQGKITESEIREAAKPLFETRMRLGEFDSEHLNPYSRIGLDVVQSEAHRELAIKAAMMSFVLLKNSNNFLPLKAKFGKVAIVGPLANNSVDISGDYMTNINAKYFKTPYETLSSLGSEAAYASGCNNAHCDLYDWWSVNAAVQDADLVIVCLGTGEYIEQEGFDRQSLQLPGMQADLLNDALDFANGAPVIVLLFNGCPVDVGWAHQSARVTAMLECFFPAQSAGDALLRTLTMTGGHASVPAARLPATWPRDLSQVAPITDYSMVNRTYRYTGSEPLYPFGYGLSYSQFEYSHIRVHPPLVTAGDTVSVSVTLTNLGPYDADEVIQVYISWPGVSVPVPLLQLVAFTRITLLVRESQRLLFDITPQQLMVWLDGRGFSLLPGTMQVHVGGQQPSQTVVCSSNVLTSSFEVVAS